MEFESLLQYGNVRYSTFQKLRDETRYRARIQRKYRTQKAARDKLQDERLAALEEQNERLESLIVYLFARLDAVGALEEGEAAKVLESLDSELEEAELIELEDGTVVPAREQSEGR